MLIYKFKKKDEELFINYIKYKLGFHGPLIFVEGDKNIFLLVASLLSTDYFRYKRKNKKRGRARLENIILKKNKVRAVIGSYSDMGTSFLGHRYYLREELTDEVTVMFSPGIDVRETDIVFDIIAKLPEL